MSYREVPGFAPEGLLRHPGALSHHTIIEYSTYNVLRIPATSVMCGRFFGIFICIPKVGHTLIFCTRKEHSRYAWLCFVLCNTRLLPVPASNFRCWSAGAFHCRTRYSSGAKRSDHSCWHIGNDEFPLPSDWRRRTPWVRCHREHLERKKIALLHN